MTWTLHLVLVDVQTRARFDGMGRPAHSTPDGEPQSDDEPGTPLLRSPITTEESAFASSVVESRQELSQEDAADLATAPYPTQVIWLLSYFHTSAVVLHDADWPPE